MPQRLHPWVDLTVLGQVFYGDQPVPQIAGLDLPLWAALYATIGWPVIWAFTEEVVYLGYLLPRLEARLRGTWRAVAVVLVFWSVQHVALPWMTDATYLTSRVLGAFVVVGTMTVVFVVWRRRLIAAMATHWLADAAAAASALFLLNR